jgi:AcrR family transcriptional regulator
MRRDKGVIVSDTVPAFDPFVPLPSAPRRQEQASPGARLNQRLRRAKIRAVTRRLLAEVGVEGITVRRIAAESGFALQTIYNLVGPRDQAITDAIAEYSLHVGRVTSMNTPTPTLTNVVDMWLAAAEAHPQFARECHRIFFSPSRDIYYRFRDIQIRGMATFLRNQEAAGAMYFHSSPRRLAEQLVFYAMAVWLDWADGDYSLAILREKLIPGLVKLSRD